MIESYTVHLLQIVNYIYNNNYRLCIYQIHVFIKPKIL
jgi:hypothetical protein